MEYYTENSCSLCRKSFKSVTNPKKQCKVCFNYVCRACSPEKVIENSVTKRICESCFQDEIQQKLFNSSNYDMVQLIFDRDSKSQMKDQIDEDIKRVTAKISQLTEEEEKLREKNEIKNIEFQDNQLYYREQINDLRESFNSYSKMILMLSSKIKDAKKEVQEVNKKLIDVNEETKFLDDKIYECSFFIKETEKEIESLNDIISESTKDIVIANERLEKNINKLHRRTINIIETLEYKNAVLKVKIKEISRNISEKEAKLNNIKECYCKYPKID